LARDVFDKEARREIGDRLRTIRGERTQAAFAGDLGVGRVALSNYERGHRLPNRETLERYARAGSTTIGWILTGVPPEVETEKYFEDIGKYIETCRRAGVLPAAIVSPEEMAILKVLRAIKISDGVRIIARIVKYYDKYPFMKNGYTDRFADQLRKICDEGGYVAGLDLEAIIEGHERITRHSKRR
jgi:transcriptional regulator with XRE-family HTH domain